MSGPKKPGSIEQAFEPIATAIRKATQPHPTAPAPAAPGKPGLAVSPLAVPFPTIPAIGGVEMTTARAGFYKHERDDLVVRLVAAHQELGRATAADPTPELEAAVRDLQAELEKKKSQLARARLRVKDLREAQDGSEGKRQRRLSLRHRDTHG